MARPPVDTAASPESLVNQTASRKAVVKMLRQRKVLKGTCEGIFTVLFYVILYTATASLDFSVEYTTMSERPMYSVAETATSVVTSRKAYWSWLEKTFLPSLLVLQDNNDRLFKEPMMLEYFKLIGGARLENFEAPQDQCEAYFDRYSCYPSAEKAVSTSNQWITIYNMLGLGMNSTNSNETDCDKLVGDYANILANITKAERRLDDIDQLELSPHGSIDYSGTYSADVGPLFDAARMRLLKAGASTSTGTSDSTGAGSDASVSSNAQAACLQAALSQNFGKQVVDMKTRMDINRATTKQTIEVAVLNNEYHRYSVLSLSFHFKRSGIVQTSYRVGSSHASNKFAAHPSKWSGKLQGEAALYGVLFLLTLYKLTFEWSDYREGKVEGTSKKIALYFSHDPWNLMDMLVYLLVLATIGLTIAREARINDITAKHVDPVHPSDGTAYASYLTRTQSLVSLIFNAVQIESWLRVARGMTVVMMGIRMLKPFSSHPKLAIVTRTLSVAITDLKYFFLIFLPMFASYVVAGHILFGATVKKFSSITDTAITSANLILLGEHQWDDMYQPNSSTIARIAAVIWFWTFLVVMFLIMLNILLAIVMDSYAVVKESMEDESDDDKAISLLDCTFELIEDYAFWMVSGLKKLCTKKKGDGESGTIVVPEDTDVMPGEKRKWAGSLSKRLSDALDTGDMSGLIDVEMMIQAGAKNQKQAVALLTVANESFSEEGDDDDGASLRDDQLLRLQQNLFEKLTKNEVVEAQQSHQLNLRQVRDAVELLNLQLQRMEKHAIAAQQ